MTVNVRSCLSQKIFRLKSGFQNSHEIIAVLAIVNRLLRCGRCVYRFQVDSRVPERTRYRALLFETPAVPRYVSCLRAAFVHAPRCGRVGGIVVDQQAHVARSRGFRKGSTWRVIHRVAGITLARWLQLVVAGPRGLMRPSFSLVYISLPSSSALLRRWLISVCMETH